MLAGNQFVLFVSPRRLEKMASDQLLGRLGGGSFLRENKFGITEGAKRLGVSPTTLRRFIRNGDIPFLRVGGKIRLLERDLDAFLEGRYSTTTPASFDQPRRRERLPDEVLHSKHLR